MAIFAGNWHDASGVPFDPDANVLQTWTGGGMAAGRRRAVRPHSAHAPFVQAVRASAERWHNDLTTQDRTDWTVQGLTGAGRRGDLARDPVNGFIMLNAYDLIQLYALPPSTVTYPAAIARTWSTATADSVDVPNQTVTFTVDSDDPIHLYAHARLATFQIHPAAVRHANPWRATRLIDLAVAADFDPLPYVATVDLRWPVASGDLVRLYWRGRVGSFWKFQHDDALTA